MSNTVRGPKIEVFEGETRTRGRGRRFYFHRRARNGEITAASEAYARRSNAIIGARRQFPGLPVIVKYDDRPDRIIFPIEYVDG